MKKKKKKEKNDLQKKFPQKSNWFLVFDPSYPFGLVEVYPAKKHGIGSTFHHQSINDLGSEGFPWRMGKLCLDTPIHNLGSVAGNTEPIGDADERMKWYVVRSVAWVRAAANRTLIKNGDPFELPQYHQINRIHCVHDESKNSFSAWKNIVPGEWGTIVWDFISGVENTIVAAAYLTQDGKLVRSNNRYRYNGDYPNTENMNFPIGIWWLWPAPIILEPWQAPQNWDELRLVGKLLKINVDYGLRGIARTIREKDSTILMVGYPIPERWGQLPSEIHWQGISIPKLTINHKPPDGFRSNEKGWWQRDRKEAFNGNNHIDYLNSQNWHPDRMQARGRLFQELRDAKIALIGCGALGSAIAELLVRGGASDLLLVDHDFLVAGNLVRHTLSGEHIGKNKAVSMAQRLSTIAPYSKISTYDKQLPVQKAIIEAMLDDREIVIDCTAVDDVPLALSLCWWSIERLFVTASVGFEAKRTFLFSHQGHFYPLHAFRNMIDPILKDETFLWSERGDVLEGAGCWSPLFPARLDDIFIAAASCIKVLEEIVETSRSETKLTVFEQITDHGFDGLKRSNILYIDQDEKCE
ncbi:MAG: ThiF family adenylyltransferase [Chloroflexi bacterium]|nr:ThiF family adenylyltransferase [Chloroflexota bacterium]